MSLIAYAGQEPEFTVSQRAYGAYNRFKAGEDTRDIARSWNVTEATVLRWINDARSAKLGLPSPYEARK